MFGKVALENCGCVENYEACRDYSLSELSSLLNVDAEIADKVLDEYREVMIIEKHVAKDYMERPNNAFDTLVNDLKFIDAIIESEGTIDDDFYSIHASASELSKDVIKDVFDRNISNMDIMDWFEGLYYLLDTYEDIPWGDEEEEVVE